MVINCTDVDLAGRAALMPDFIARDQVRRLVDEVDAVVAEVLPAPSTRGPTWPA